VEACFTVTLSSCPLGEGRETKLTQIDYDREIAQVPDFEEVIHFIATTKQK